MFFYLFTLRSVCGCGNSSQQTSLQCMSTINMSFSYEDQILIKTQIHSIYTVIKIGALKCIFLHFSISAEYLQKIYILIFQGSVATCLRWDGYCYVSFVANFIHFPGVQNFENRLRFNKVIECLKVGTFFETQSIYHKLDAASVGCGCCVSGTDRVVL